MSSPRVAYSVFAVLCWLLSAAFVPTLVRAEDAVTSGPDAQLTLRIAGHALDERVVIVGVSGVPAGAATLVLRLDGVEATRVPVAVGTGDAEVRLGIAAESADIGADALDAFGVVIAASSESLPVRESQFIPAYPRVSVRWDAFVLPSQSISLGTARAESVTARLGGRACESTEHATGTSFNVVLPARVPEGRTRLRVYVANAWGVRSLSVPLWSLRWRPTTSRAVLVDKSDFTLYYAEKGRMHKVYPVAIGMPGTPTHVGHFWLGAPRPAGGPWGVLRMALSKRRGTGGLPSWGGYYIHGTNQPDSIGTEASHGCVRMYNSGVIDLSRHTRRGITNVTIRP